MNSRDLNQGASTADNSAVNRHDFLAFRDVLEKISGIHLPENKSYLIATRLRKLMQERKIPDLRSLLDTLQINSDLRLRTQVIDAMTTNETFWFRDSYPFEYFQKQLLPAAFAQKTGKIRVWCAACSSGQEPYSLAMIVDEMTAAGGKFSGRQVEIVATDISASILDRSKQGIYDRLEITRGMSGDRVRRYFHQLDENQWQINESLRRRINFKALNLTEPFSPMGKFDVIFCRNVLIYFSAELKLDILTRLRQQLVANGTLFLGASEGIGGAGQLYKMLQCNPGIAFQAI